MLCHTKRLCTFALFFDYSFISLIMRKYFIAIALLTLICACNKKQEQTGEKVIGKPEIQVQDGRFTPEVMWALGKMTDKAVSPDGKQIAWSLNLKKYCFLKRSEVVGVGILTSDGSQCGPTGTCPCPRRVPLH